MTMYVYGVHAITSSSHLQTLTLMFTHVPTCYLQFENGVVADYAGGAYLGLGFTSDIQNTLFIDNTGGGEAGATVISYDTTATSYNCSWIKNYSQNQAGALLVFSGGTVSLDHALFERNTAGSDGGAISVESASAVELTVSASELVDNVAGGRGGAVCLDDAFASLTLTETAVVNNIAGVDGGGVYVAGSAAFLALESSRVESNSAGQNGGGVYAFTAPAVALTDTLVASNSASYGGGLLTVLSAAVLGEGTVFRDNSHYAVASVFSTPLIVVNSSLSSGAAGVVTALGGTQLVVSNSVLSGTGAAVALDLNSVTGVSLVNSLIGGDGTAAGTPALDCSSSDVYVTDSVLCTDSYAGLSGSSGSSGPAMCFECSLSGQYSSCYELADADSCAVGCAAQGLCLHDSARSAAPNHGCHVCDSQCLSSPPACNATSEVCFDTAASLPVQSSYMCACATGFEPTNSSAAAPPVPCSDVNECSSGTHDCTGIAVCVNTVGSYSCECPAGYSGPDPTCEDINECESGSDPCGNAICANTVGSFSCACNKPFYVYGNSSECRSCGPGYHLLSNGDACVACNADTYNAAGLNIYECPACPSFSSSGAGAVQCTCETGLTMVNGSCVDICVLGEKQVAPTLCLPCSKGFYGSVAGVCTPCPLGLTTEGVGQTECVCAPGYAPVANPPNGSLSSSTSTSSSSSSWMSIVCTKVCGPGFYLNTVSSICVPCADGSYSPSEGPETTCVPCPVGGAVTAGTGATNASQCECPDGTAAEPFLGGWLCAKQCGPGYARPSTDSSCEVCGTNHYTDSLNAVACSACPVNAVAPTLSTHVTDCVCPRDYYTRDGEHGTPCYACPVGAKCR